VALALRRRDATWFLPTAILAMWFTLGGHYVEVVFLNGVRNRLPRSRVVQMLARLATWSCAGVLLYSCMAATARGFWPGMPFLMPWWFGALLFTGIELVVHAGLAFRGLPNFYNGRG
jgi:hypothetical protein